MAMDLASIVTAPPSGRSTAVIIDHRQYTQALILRGQAIPWADPGAYSRFFGQAQGLLKPDAALLDLGAWYDDALAANPGLTSALSARSRTGYALKTLLADEKAAAAALELAGVVSQTSAAPLIVQIPSPMLWLARMHQLSGAGTVADLDAEQAENAAMYVADWVRRLSLLPVSLLLLDERWTASGHLPLVEDSAYAPVANVCAHYRWALARRMDDRIPIMGTTAAGVVVPQSFWRSDAANPPSGEFLFAEIPADTVPETVLSQLAKLT